MIQADRNSVVTLITEIDILGKKPDFIDQNKEFYSDYYDSYMYRYFELIVCYFV